MTVQASGKGRGKDLDYVFLICSERCGSNLISTILGAHPRVKSPPPYHFARDVISNLHRRDDPAAWDAVKAQLLHRVTRLTSEEKAAQVGVWLDKHPKAGAAEMARFVYVDLDPKPGATTVFVKENNLHTVMAFVLTCFPQAKFVFQVRDPRDYLASAQARKGFWGGNKFGSNRHALEVWRDDQQGGLGALGLLGPERVFFQRYEDLISRPREVLEPLCKFLGLKFEEAMLTFHESDAATRLAESASARANVSRPLMASNSGKYREQLVGRSDPHGRDLAGRPDGPVRLRPRSRASRARCAARAPSGRSSPSRSSGSSTGSSSPSTPPARSVSCRSSAACIGADHARLRQAREALGGDGLEHRAPHRRRRPATVPP